MQKRMYSTSVGNFQHSPTVTTAEEKEAAMVNYNSARRRGGREAEGGGLLNRYTG
jgi:hypothetical protein